MDIILLEMSSVAYLVAAVGFALFTFRPDVGARQLGPALLALGFVLQSIAVPFRAYSVGTIPVTTFFDGLSFHRVIPNFVVQGGCPRGDGWGGPGYAIRDEYSDEPYGRGTVGIATSGKDTGGSQFFITHSPQPHLEARYTVFGQVIEGMDVVDQLVIGDVIENIEIRKGQI